MTDTTQHIYDIQLKGWLSKTPGERLHQFMIDNEALLHFFNNVKATGNTASKVCLTENNEVEPNQNIQQTNNEHGD